MGTSPARLAASSCPRRFFPGSAGSGAPGVAASPHSSGTLPSAEDAQTPSSAPTPVPSCLSGSSRFLPPQNQPCPRSGHRPGCPVSLVHHVLGALPLESLCTHCRSPPASQERQWLLLASSLSHSPRCRELSRRPSPHHLPTAGLRASLIGPMSIRLQGHRSPSEGGRGRGARPSCMRWVFAGLAWFTWSSVMSFVHWKM